MDNPKKSPTILSLCAGYGGIEKGIESVIGKCTILAHVEIEAFAIANLVNKMEAGKMDPVPVWTDLKTFDAKPFRDCVDILTGGFPCQPFSLAGKQAGTEDPRHLWPYIEKIIKTCRPANVFLENVEGIISTKTILHRPDLIAYCQWSTRRLGKTWGALIFRRFTKWFGISVLQFVMWRLEKMGYRCESGIFSAAEVGAPHQRKRVFILADYDDCGSYSRSKPTRREKRSNACWSCERSEMANAGDKRLQKCWYPGEVRKNEKQACSTTSRSGNQWPARPGENQREWEEPRCVEPKLGRTIDGSENRIDRLRLLGNGVVPQVVEKAYLTLLEKLKCKEP